MKKIIAPVIITLLIILWVLAYFILSIVLNFHIIAKVAIGLVSLGACAVSIYVLVERIKEVRSGEEDDLSKY